MTLTLQTAEGAARALAIAGLALLLAPSLARLLAHTHGRQRMLVWALLLAPLLTPALLVSYAYSHVALRLLTVPGATSALYCVALMLKLVPVAALILHFVPPAMSPRRFTPTHCSRARAGNAGASACAARAARRGSRAGWSFCSPSRTSSWRRCGV